MAMKKKNIVAEEVSVELPVKEDVIETETTFDGAEEVSVEDKVEVDVNAHTTSHRTEGNVKIKMRTNHKCTIAMERYDLKAGQTYVVPENVKRILNNAGLLAPL